MNMDWEMQKLPNYFYINKKLFPIKNFETEHVKQCFFYIIKTYSLQTSLTCQAHRPLSVHAAVPVWLHSVSILRQDLRFYLSVMYKNHQ